MTYNKRTVLQSKPNTTVSKTSKQANRRIIYRLLATDEARGILNALIEYNGMVSSKDLMIKSGLSDRETKFYIVIKELWRSGMIDRSVDVERDVSYKINGFGKSLYRHSQQIDSKIDEFEQPLNVA